MGRVRRKTRRASSDDFVPREASSYAYPIPRKLPNFAIHIMGLPHPECEQLTYDVSEKALLGDSVSIDVWMEMVAQGRGASVCVAGNLTRLSSVAGTPATFGVSDESLLSVYLKRNAVKTMCMFLWFSQGETSKHFTRSCPIIMQAIHLYSYPASEQRHSDSGQWRRLVRELYMHKTGSL